MKKIIVYSILVFAIINNSLLSKEIFYDSTLAEGVHYYNYKISTGDDYHSVHAIEIDISTGDNSIAILKAKNQNRELDRLHDIVDFYDSLYDNHVLGSINANFWRAYSNNPIGPTVINGEVVEQHQYKSWSSIFFSQTGVPYIDNFDINVEISSGSKTFPVETINKRSNSRGVVIYNKYGGDVIPYITTSTVEKLREGLLEDAIADTAHQDITDIEMDIVKLEQQLLFAERLEMKEYSLVKAKLIYLESPAINKDIPCVVLSIDTGAVDVPTNGVILSFGEDFEPADFPMPGDTVTIRMKTTAHQDVVFLNSVSGTPRLVREGRAYQEAQSEGSRSRRFISSKLPRTAIGYNKDKTKVYLVTVENGWRRRGCVGASLDDLSQIMKKLGCHDAINLDGGGSSIMVINDRNVMKSDPESSRRISVGIGVIRNIRLLKNIFKK